MQRSEQTAGAAAFEAADARLGRFSLRPLRIPEDMMVVHDWVTRPYARFWGMSGQSLEQVTTGYEAIARRAVVFLGLLEGEPTFLVERYDPADDPIARHYPVEAGDRGMHVLIAPVKRPVRDFTWAVFRTVMDFVFDDPDVRRVVVEPDIRNARIHALNRRAGFRYVRAVELPHKTAHLAFCTRAQHEAARSRDGRTSAAAAASTALAAAAGARSHEHLRPEVWAAVNRVLVRKTISELAHERVIEPRLDTEEVGAEASEWKRYVLDAPAAGVTYQFRARRLPLDHWDIDADSLERRAGQQQLPLEALDLVVELSPALAMPDEMLPVYVEEIASTLYAAAYKRHHQALSSADLVHAEFQEIEAAMTEGHPSFIANSGRVGFDAADHGAYAPEAAAPVRLVWLAAHARHTEFASVAELPYEELLRRELGAAQLAAFSDEIARRGLDPEAYRLIPVHPWQWFNKLALIFAPDIAARDLVCLGYGADTYRAQQSIRTFFNLSRPERCYVKTALSVLNMGFMRGLSADYMSSTPAICAWIDDLVTRDPYLASKGFRILREVAGIGYRSPLIEAAVAKQSPYRKMLAALWRESALPRIAPGERLMTMAALLHRDRDGRALLPQLIKASGLDAGAWLDRYLDAYLAPLVHCLERHDLAFMPHGENVIVVLDGNVPARVLMKDIAEEAAIMNTDAAASMPERARRLCVSVPNEIKPLSIFTDVFDGIFRYLSQILHAEADFPVSRFWERVAACLTRYERDQPAGAGRRHDLFVPEFRRSCLNRLQLTNNRQMIDLADPAKNLRFAGVLANPVAPFRS